MSKLDYVTIAIVGICIMAILFLIYKMTNVFSDDKQKDKIEVAADSLDAEDEDVYDYEIDQNVDSTGSTPSSASNDKTTAAKPAITTVPAERTESSASSTPAEDDTNDAATKKTNSGSAASDDAEKTNYSEGKYMVLAGSFTQKAYADSEVKKLNKLGYDDAHVELFDRGKYAVVLVERFENMAEAERLVKKLSGDGVKSYVKAKS